MAFALSKQLSIIEVKEKQGITVANLLLTQDRKFVIIRPKGNYTPFFVDASY